MNVLEMLARTTAHGVSYGQVGRSTLIASAQDIEWMMVGLPKFQEHLIRAAYQHDQDAKHGAWSMWFQRLMARGWKTDRPNVVENMATESLNYWISPKKCPACHGVGELLAGSLLVKCEPCDGTGRRERSASRVCFKLGFARGNVYPVWITRWNESLAELDREEGKAARHMLEKLKGKKRYTKNV